MENGFVEKGPDPLPAAKDWTQDRSMKRPGILETCARKADRHDHGWHFSSICGVLGGPSFLVSKFEYDLSAQQFFLPR